MSGTSFCKKDSCQIINLNMKSSGGFSSDYQPSSFVLNPASAAGTFTGRRVLAGSSTISNPVVCINEGDTMSWQIYSRSHYPVYASSSFLNSNPTFDDTDFKTLKSQLQSGMAINYFEFTFNTAGKYVFYDAGSPSSITVIGVMNSATGCPDSTKNIQPISYSSLLLLGTKQNPDILLEPDWPTIFSLLGFVLFCLPIIVGMLYYAIDRNWIKGKVYSIPYRDKHQKTEDKLEVPKGTSWVRNPLESTENVGGIIAEEDNLKMGRLSEKDLEMKKVRKEENINGVYEVEVGKFHEIYQELQKHTTFAKRELALRASKDDETLRRIYKEIDAIKLLMQDKLKRLAKSYGKNINLIFKDNKDPSDKLFLEGENVLLEKQASLQDEIQPSQQQDQESESPQDIADGVSALINADREMKEESRLKLKELFNEFMNDYMRNVEASTSDIVKKFKEIHGLSDDEIQNLLLEFQGQMSKLGKEMAIEAVEREEAFKIKNDLANSSYEILRKKLSELSAEKQKLIDENNELINKAKKGRADKFAEADGDID